MISDVEFFLGWRLRVILLFIVTSRIWFVCVAAVSYQRRRAAQH